MRLLWNPKFKEILWQLRNLSQPKATILSKFHPWITQRPQTRTITERAKVRRNACAVFIKPRITVAKRALLVGTVLRKSFSSHIHN